MLLLPCLEQAQTVIIGVEDGPRVGMKGEKHALSAHLGSQLVDALQNALMPAMHPVEGACGDHRAGDSEGLVDILVDLQKGSRSTRITRETQLVGKSASGRREKPAGSLRKFQQKVG